MHGKYLGRVEADWDGPCIRLEADWDCVLSLIQTARVRIHMEQVAMATAEELSGAILISSSTFQSLFKCTIIRRAILSFKHKLYTSYSTTIIRDTHILAVFNFLFAY